MADVPFAVIMSLFGAVGRYYRPVLFLSPLSIQTICRFLLPFPVSPLPANVLRGGRKSKWSLTIQERVD
jgi:hypothetical protein